MRNIIAAIIHLFLFMLIASGAQAQKKDKRYTITGTVKGLGNSKVYLGHYYQDQSILDSVMAKDGQFVFTGTVPGPLQHFIRFEKMTGGMTMFVENALITVETDTAWSAIKVTGSATQPLYDEFVNLYMYIHKKAGPTNSRMNTSYRAKDTSAYAAALKDMKVIMQEADSLYTDFVKRNPASPVAPYVIIDRFINYPNPVRMEECYALLEPAALNTVYGKQVTTYRQVMLRTAVGAKPAFALADSTGKKVALKDFKGQYVLVDFWASWCGPCRKENPNIVKAYQKYHDKGFEVLAISLDNKKDLWLKAIKADSLPWKHVSDLKGWQSELATLYGIKSIPASFLVDKEGKVIAQNLRGKDLEAKLEALLP